jgi:hypothetical protein
MGRANALFRAWTTRYFDLIIVANRKLAQFDPKKRPVDPNIDFISTGFTHVDLSDFMSSP